MVRSATTRSACCGHRRFVDAAAAASRAGQAVVEAARQRADVAVARLVGVLAGLVARHQFEHAQRQRRHAGADGAQRIQRQLPARAFGGQEEDLSMASSGAGLEQREQRAYGLADAGGCLGQQAAADAGGVEHRLQRGCAGRRGTRRAESASSASASVARAAVAEFAVGPGQEALAQVFEELPAVRPRCSARAARCSCWLPMSKYTRDTVEFARSQMPAQQPAVDLGLRPVQLRGGWRAWRSKSPLKVLTSSSRRRSASKPSARPRTRRCLCWPLSAASLR